MAYRTSGFGFGGFTLTPMVKKLLFANFGMFLITWLLPSRFVLEWLAFRPDHVLTRPWGTLGPYNRVVWCTRPPPRRSARLRAS